MTAPIIQSVQVSGTTLYIIFDRAISATLGSELNGFTFLKNGSSNTPVFSVITQNALIATLGTALVGGDTYTTTYVSGSGTVVDAATGLSPATSFGPLAYVAYPTVPKFVYGVVGEGGNNKIALHFSAPVGATGGTFITGTVVSINAVPISMVGVTAAANSDQTVWTLTFPSNFTYNAVVTSAYTPGTLYTWPAGALAAFTATFLNVSTDGEPDSAYPLSYVTNYAIDMISTVARARLGVSLNPVDIELVKRYGPVIILTGGTFGVTMDNPSGVQIMGRAVTLVDGADIVQDFHVTDHVPYAVDAAKDWEVQITVKIGVALGALRALDQSITLGDNVVVSV